MKLVLIRHGKTCGNLEGRYIGWTDEPLSPAGLESLKGRKYPQVREVYVSPLMRCRETADLLYAGLPVTVVEDFKECNFGAFERKNYEELKEDINYQRWLDSGGRQAFPGGEGREDFSARVIAAFDLLQKKWKDQGLSSAALVVHGGTIMAILERFAVPRKDFYDWQIKNGEAYTAELSWNDKGQPLLEKVTLWLGEE